MKKVLSYLLDWIYKKKCYFCSSSKESIKMCSKCFAQLENLPAFEQRSIFGTKVYCAGSYENVLQKLIRGVKYHKQKDLAYFQAKFMYDFWLKTGNLSNSYQIVPVPMFKTREKQRRYNHMALVAQEFSKLTGYEVNLELVQRIKDTIPQYNLKKEERIKNLSGAFSVNKNKLLKGDVLLFDDICTTGATFENIVGELKKQGIENIVCLASATPFAQSEVCV